ISEDAFTGSGAMSALSCTPSQPATLAPNDVLSCTATYDVTQADVDAGCVDNHASATGTPPTGPPVTDTDDATVPSTPAPGLTLVKRVDSVDDVNGNGLTDAGDQINYVFDVENTGNLTMDPVVINDTLLDGLGITITCDPDALAPGESVTCEADAPYVITLADVNAGGVTNVATATGTPPTGPPTTTPPTTTTTPTDPSPGMTLAKRVDSIDDVNGNGRNDAGDEINYVFDVENTGNTTITDIVVDDPLLADAGIAVTCAPDSLAPGQSVTCEADEPYVITAADVRRGYVRNVATAVGTPPPGTELPPTPPSTTTTLTPPSGVSGESNESLPNTGGPPLAGLAGGLAALLMGVALAVSSRRRYETR
ncbi:MAG: hypothetical protein NTX33_07540, partial [Propionibacteriales bacterium]|nr:hypothetical protein [Propionibacteriales bacterium]